MKHIFVTFRKWNNTGKGQKDMLWKFREWCCRSMLSGGPRENQVERHSGRREQPKRK